MSYKISTRLQYGSVTLLLYTCVFLSSCSSSNKPVNPTNMPVPVNLYTLHMQAANYYDEYPGNVVALSQVDLRAEVEGYITGIYFTEGEHIRKGQKLYEIDKRKYQASYDQASANVKVAEANLDQMQKDADRYIYLNQHDAVAKQTLDHAMTSLANAKNQLAAAKQDMVRAQTDLKFSSITAPFDGTIGLSQVKLGTLASPGQTILNTVSTDDPMAVDFVVNEKQVGRFIKLQQFGSKPGDSLFTIITPDNNVYQYPGKISVIDRGIDPQTGTIKIRLVFPNQQSGLRAGMSCIVRVHNQDTKDQMIIPSKAIVEQMGEYFVFVAKDTVLPEPKDKKEEQKGPAPHLKASQKKVNLGQTIGANVIVKTGLDEGDRVIVDGVQKLRDGSVIMVAEKPAGGAGAH